ncbi:dymeclin isoform X2 [Centruroides vittatus]|uniref:dymeclin isoform X2 n=1 Tax=Centruroides vittatus TaxID=120091 RepID=UPI00350F8BB7
MGVSSSSLNDLQKNEYLHRFSGKESISPNDPFWNQFLSFTFTPPQTCADCRLLEESVQQVLRNLLTNNLQTRNFNSLIKVFLLHAAELKVSTQCENSVFTWQTYNALFILRCIIKYFIETITEEHVIKQFQVKSKGKDDDDADDRVELLESFINSLLEIIVDVPVIDITYAVTVEAINTLLVMLSVQMFSKSTTKSIIYKTIMQGKCAIHAFLVIKVLLQHYYQQQKCPPNFHSTSSSGSIILGLASGLWNVLTFGYGKGSGNAGKSVMEEAMLAKQSLLLLLVLVNHCTNEKEFLNPYRQALFSFTNSQDSSNTSLSVAIPTFKLDYTKLYSTLSSTLSDDQTTLLLYLLLHRNIQFKNFILSRTDVDALVIPILKILYNAPERSSHNIYMALIVLLILSEDDLFNESIHDIILKNISWYTERTISEISLGGLLVLVVIRTIQYNMTRMRDKYLHTNCLAALANMSNHFKRLHPYVCQRFVSLFENLAKRLSRIMYQFRTSNESARIDIDDNFSTDLMQDLSILEEVLRMVLEILNSCLTAQLAHNPNLLYTLLYKRHVFEIFRTHPTFQDIIQNIDTVLVFFSSKLETADKNLSVAEVSEIIKQATLQWPCDKLKKFPELKFKYVEEEQPEEFFTPYVWSLVFQASNLYWNPQHITLFNPNKET